jgi:hypothetical protein
MSAMELENAVGADYAVATDRTAGRIFSSELSHVNHFAAIKEKLPVTFDTPTLDRAARNYGEAEQLIYTKATSWFNSLPRKLLPETDLQLLPHWFTNLCKSTHTATLSLVTKYYNAVASVKKLPATVNNVKDLPAKWRPKISSEIKSLPEDVRTDIINSLNAVQVQNFAKYRESRIKTRDTLKNSLFDVYPDTLHQFMHLRIKYCSTSLSDWSFTPAMGSTKNSTEPWIVHLFSVISNAIEHKRASLDRASAVQEEKRAKHTKEKEQEERLLEEAIAKMGNDRESLKFIHDHFAAQREKTKGKGKKAASSSRSRSRSRSGSKGRSTNSTRSNTRSRSRSSNKSVRENTRKNSRTRANNNNNNNNRRNTSRDSRASASKSPVRFENTNPRGRSTTRRASRAGTPHPSRNQQSSFRNGSNTRPPNTNGNNSAAGSNANRNARIRGARG